MFSSEFSISPEALDALSSFVNAHGALYDQGLAFGGINGVAVKHIHGDGYWNQVRFADIIGNVLLTNLNKLNLLILHHRGMSEDRGTLRLDRPTT